MRAYLKCCLNKQGLSGRAYQNTASLAARQQDMSTTAFDFHLLKAANAPF